MKREDVKDYKKNIPDNNAGKNDVAEGDIRHSSGKKYKRPVRIKKQNIKSPLIIGLIFSVLVLLVIVCSFGIDKAMNGNADNTSVDVVKTETANAPGDSGHESETSEEISKEDETEDETTIEETTQVQSTTAVNNSDDKDEYPGVKKVYLTFDDGPSSITSDILDVLDCYGVKATFFTVCNTSESAIQNMQRIVNSGHTIGIHSVSHKYSTVYASLDSFKKDVLDMQQFIYENTGYKTFFYRFPGGSSNTIAQCDIGECIQFLDEAGFEYFDWNVESGDATGNMIPKDTIVNNVLSSLGDRDEYMVLMHDAEPKKTTLEALPEIIEGIQSRGYQILPITENTKPVHHRRKNN